MSFGFSCSHFSILQAERKKLSIIMSRNVHEFPEDKPRSKKKTASKKRAKAKKTSAKVGAFSASGVEHLAEATLGNASLTSSNDGNHHVDYGKIYKWLVILFVISVTGPILGIKWLTILTAFGIAIVKASLVANYFMHLKFEKQFIWLLMLTCLLFLFVLFTFVAPDILNHEGANWENVREMPVHPMTEAANVAAPTASAEESAFE